MTTLLISDLHLDADRPAAIDIFLDFVAAHAVDADALYVLGDLFEAWIGDDDPEPAYGPVVEALADLKRRGVPCFFMHGNRDFLVGERFAAAAGCELLGDYATVEIAGRRVLLTHGDLLCTDDAPYQRLRATLRDPQWQREFLARPVAERRALANELRDKSRTETAAKPEDIMDVNPATVERIMRVHDVTTLVHGHTHRPAVHRFTLDGEPATRIVLGAWHGEGSMIRWDRGGFELLRLPELSRIAS